MILLRGHFVRQVGKAIFSQCPEDDLRSHRTEVKVAVIVLDKLFQLRDNLWNLRTRHDLDVQGGCLAGLRAGSIDSGLRVVELLVDGVSQAILVGHQG